MVALLAISLFGLITVVIGQSCPSGESAFLSGDGTPLACKTTKKNSCPTNYACRRVSKNVPQYRSLCCHKEEPVSGQSASCPTGESPFLYGDTNTPYICNSAVANSCPVGSECRTVPGNASQYLSLCCLPMYDCMIPYDSGTICESSPSVSRWYFDSVTNTCQMFNFNGCDGNANKFETLSMCLQSCSSDTRFPTVNGHSASYNCMLAFDSGTMCESASSGTRWYFDSVTGACQMFNFNGCDGNGNNFASQSMCMQSCGSETQSPAIGGQSASYTCTIPYDSGTMCESASSGTRWYFDWATGMCQSFNFNGCDGNGNNFATLSMCEQSCGGADKQGPVDVISASYKCMIPYDSGTMCESSSSGTRWYYDSVTGACQSFNYNGCDGNVNNFVSQSTCVDSCGGAEKQVQVQTGSSYNCIIPYDSGTICETSPSVARWYFDSVTGTCQMFFYNGCDGNGNNFASRSACTVSCGNQAQFQSDGRVGSSCSYNIDCITGSECNSGMCACRSDRVAIDGYCYLNFPTENA